MSFSAWKDMKDGEEGLPPRIGYDPVARGWGEGKRRGTELSRDIERLGNGVVSAMPGFVNAVMWVLIWVFCPVLALGLVLGMQEYASKAFPQLVGPPTAWLATTYRWLFHAPVHGGEYVFDFVATPLHARFPAYSDYFGLGAVCCCIVLLCALVWRISAVLKVRKLAVVGVICVGPAAVYIVWILLLSLVVLGRATASDVRSEWPLREWGSGEFMLTKDDGSTVRVIPLGSEYGADSQGRSTLFMDYNEFSGYNQDEREGGRVSVRYYYWIQENPPAADGAPGKRYTVLEGEAAINAWDAWRRQKQLGRMQRGQEQAAP